MEILFKSKITTKKNHDIKKSSMCLRQDEVVIKDQGIEEDPLVDF